MGYGRRPTGVTLLAVLSIIVVIAAALMAIVFFMLTSLLENPTILQSLLDSGMTQAEIDSIKTISPFYGVLFLSFTVIFALLAYSLFTGARWGWILGVGFSIFLITFALIQFILTPSIGGIAGLIFEVVIQFLILYYLNTPAVVAWFKGPGTRGLWGGPEPPQGMPPQGQY